MQSFLEALPFPYDSTVYRKSRDFHGDPMDRSHQTLRLTDQYIALLVLVFTHAGLIDVSMSAESLSCQLLQALTSMLEETTTGSNLSRKATLLIAEVLRMANRVLPFSAAARIQVCDSVVRGQILIGGRPLLEFSPWRLIIPTGNIA